MNKIIDNTHNINLDCIQNVTVTHQNKIGETR